MGNVYSIGRKFLHLYGQHIILHRHEQAKQILSKLRNAHEQRSARRRHQRRRQSQSTLLQLLLPKRSIYLQRYSAGVSGVLPPKDGGRGPLNIHGVALHARYETAVKVEKRMSCPHNIAMHCPCTYRCHRRGKCCECVASHSRAGEFPACFFSREAEARYDRSFEALQRDRKRG